MRRIRSEMGSSPRLSPLLFVLRVAVHGTAATSVLATLVLAGQPILANDTWIHLALGRAFAMAGPWLAQDPYLFSAPGPPSPGSWLGSVAIWGIQSVVGFTGLRIAHAAFVGAILLLAWVCFRRATGSATVASAGLVSFIVLSTYRLVQLRPALFSIAAVLLIYLLVVKPKKGPGLAAIGAAVLLSVLWANVHAAFLLGPALVLGAGASLSVVGFLRGRGSDSAEIRRARRIGMAGLLMLLATLANPQGWKAHLAYVESGRRTMALTAVVDEWNRTNLLAWPQPNLPPTLAAWLVCWLGVLGICVATVVLFRELRLERSDVDMPTHWRVDPALFALAVAGIFAAVLASRFLWLGIFPMMLLGSFVSGARRNPRRTIVADGLLAFFGIGVLIVHFQLGDWPLVSRAIGVDGSRYVEPYHAGKYYGHAMWFLADSGVEGRIYNDYELGGFMSYWLSPRLMMASSGTMNMALGAMEANLAIGGRRPIREDEGYPELLDRVGLDLFLGRGLPVEASPGRPMPTTVRHLEHEPGWLLVFRNLRSAVYLRKNDRNRPNLDRIEAYYENEGVPFDSNRGFDPERVIVKARQWAIRHGLIPKDFDAILDAARRARAKGEIDLQTRRLALLYAVLGLYERALVVDESIVRLNPRDTLGAHGVVWSLLQLGRLDGALAFASRFESRFPGSAVLGRWSAAIVDLTGANEVDRASTISLIPLLAEEQTALVRLDTVDPRARTSREEH